MNSLRELNKHLENKDYHEFYKDLAMHVEDQINENIQLEKLVKILDFLGYRLVIAAKNK